MMQRLIFGVLLFLPFFICAQQAKLILPVGHSQAVVKATFSPNNRFVLTASYDGTAKLWDKASGRLLHTYSLHWQELTDIAFSADGKLIATASNDSTIGIWETISGKLKYHLNHGGQVSKVSFNNSSTELVSSSILQRNVKIWDLSTGSLSENIDRMIEGAFLKDDRYLHVRDFRNAYVCLRNGNDVNCVPLDGEPGTPVMLSDQSGFVTVWNDSTLAFLNMEGKIVKTTRMDFSIGSFSLSSDEKVIALVSRNSPYAEVRRLADTTLLAQFGMNDTAYGNRIKAKFSEGGNYFFIALQESDKFQVYSIQNKNLKQERAYPTGFSAIADVTFSPDGKEFVVVSYSDDVDLWSVNHETPVTSFRGYAYSKKFAQTVGQDSFTVVQSTRTNIEFWDNREHKLIYTLENDAGAVNAICLSADESMIASVNSNNDIQVRETRSGRLLMHAPAGIVNSPDGIQTVPEWVVSNRRVEPFIENTLKKTAHNFEEVFFGHNARIIATITGQTSALPLWDSQTGKLIANINLGADGVFDVAFAPDDKKVAAVGRDGAAILFDISSRKLTPLRGHTGPVFTVAFHPSGSHFVTAGSDSTFRVWENEGKLLQKHFVGGKVKKVIFSPNGEKMLLITGKYLGIFPVKKMDDPRWINPRDMDIGNVMFFNRDPNELLITFDDFGPLRININTQTFDDLAAIGGADYVSISKHDDVIITAGANRITKWDAKKGEQVSSFFTVGDGAFFSDIPGNFYRSSPGASKLLHYVTADLNVIGFDQLDIKYNRPDKVLAAIGCKDTSLIKSYERAYLKRIRKLGIDTTQFKTGYSVPEADVRNRDGIPVDVTTPQLTLKIRAADSVYRLDRFNVWVNEVPVFGMKGLKIKGRNPKTFDTTLVVTLSQGENSIETSVTNSNSIESFRKPLLVRYTPVTPKQPQVYFIGIGINQFADATHNLNWSVKDIRDLSLKLKEKYPNIKIDTLFDKRVTRDNIINLKLKLKALREDDIVIVSYSGHGILSTELDYYLSTYDVDFEHPAIKGLSYDELEGLLDNIKPRKKLMLIDACHSGELDKEDIVKIKSSANSLAGLGIQAKGVEVEIEKKLGLENSFELMQSLFVNVSRGTGATIISAAGGMQFAQERGDLRNGVFTYSIIDAINKHSSLKVSELKKLVEENVTRLTRGLQKPTSRNQTHGFDWVVW